MIKWVVVAVGFLLAGMVASASAQDDSCALAGNGVCNEAPYGDPPVCPMLTDVTDCRSDQIANGSGEWPLNPSDLIGRSPEWLRLARNEIFARHGRSFSSSDLDQLFRARDWYQPADGEIALSDVERANVALLARFEETPDMPLTSAGWPRATGSWSGVLEVEGQPPRQALGYGTAVRLEPAGKGDAIVLLRPDHDLAYSWMPDLEDGSAHVLGGLLDVPLTVRTLAAYGVEPERMGVETINGEPVARFELTGTDEAGAPIFEGFALVTPDGIVLEADYRYLALGCCGEEPDWRHARYRLTDIERGAQDPATFDPPVIDYVMSG